MSRPIAATVLLTTVAAVAGAADGEISNKDVRKDVEHALETIGKESRVLLRQKGIDWKAVAREFKKAAKEVDTEQDEFMLLVRLVARVRDGHARVEIGEGVAAAWPDRGPWKGPGMFWCRNGDDILVKNVWGDAEAAGVEAGMRVVEVDGEKANTWFAAKIAELRDTHGFSTDHQAEYFAFHWGLAGPRGSLLALELRGVDGKRKKARVPRTSGSFVPWGPVVFPDGLQRVGRQSYGTLESGFGYIHLRDVKAALPEQLDQMLAALGNVPGLILDCRANGGGSTDHDAVFGRFVPAGETVSFGKTYRSAGDTPYGGPMIVIVDAGVRSAGETIAGQFKEDGRAYMIGPEPTAGMSSQKTRIELPSKRFSLIVSTHSNKARFNDGTGIEGQGVPPHELVPYDSELLASGVDPMIQRAEELLRDFPQDAVPYEPEKFGWERE